MEERKTAKSFRPKIYEGDPKTKIDKKTGLKYIPFYEEYGYENQSNILTEDNLNFIKLLRKYYLFKLKSKKAKSFKIEDIKEVAKYLYDSDLNDDMFDNDYTFPPLPPDNMNEVFQETIDFHINIAKKKKEKIIKFNSKNNDTNGKKDKNKEAYYKDRLRLAQFYIFMRRCAILYRDTDYKSPYRKLRKLLKEKDFDIRVKAHMEEGELWGSGEHEWLTSSQLNWALKRTAGKEEGVEPCLKKCIWVYDQQNQENGEWERQQYNCAEFNWLDLQLLFRTPTKYVIFLDKVNYQINGAHVGAIKKSINDKGYYQEKQGWFHNQLNSIFNNSKSINEYVNEVNEFIQPFLISTTNNIKESSFKYFMIDGGHTEDLRSLKKFQMKAKTNLLFPWLLRDINQHKKIIRKEKQLFSDQIKENKYLFFSKNHNNLKQNTNSQANVEKKSQHYRKS